MPGFFDVVLSEPIQMFEFLLSQGAFHSRRHPQHQTLGRNLLAFRYQRPGANDTMGPILARLSTVAWIPIREPSSTQQP